MSYSDDDGAFDISADEEDVSEFILQLILANNCSITLITMTSLEKEKKEGIWI